jgi:hypothetical protein
LAVGPPLGFLWNLVASANFMRLSSWKGAHAAFSSAAWQEIRVPGLAFMAIIAVSFPPKVR